MVGSATLISGFGRMITLRRLRALLTPVTVMAPKLACKLHMRDVKPKTQQRLWRRLQLHLRDHSIRCPVNCRQTRSSAWSNGLAKRQNGPWLLDLIQLSYTARTVISFISSNRL